MPETSDRFRQLFMRFVDAVFIEDSAGIIREANLAAATLLACTRDQLLGRNRSDFLTPASLERLTAQRRLLKPQERLQSDAQIRANNGKLINIILDISLLGADEGQLLENPTYVVVARVSSRRDELERELRLQRQSAEVQYGEYPHATFFISSRYEISRYPPPPAQGEVRPLDWAYTAIMSASLAPALNRAWSGEEVILPPAWYSPLRTPADDPAGMKVNAKDLIGQRWLKIVFSPIRLRGQSVTDVCVHVLDCTSERVENENRRLAAHHSTASLLSESLFQELNNYLGVILIQASAFTLALGPGQPVPESLTAIADAARQAAGFLSRAGQIGDLSTEKTLREIDLNAILADLAPLLAHRLRKTTEVLLELEPAMPRVRGNPDLLQMLIVALATHLQNSRPQGQELILRSIRSPDLLHGNSVGAGVQMECTFEGAAAPGELTSTGDKDEETLELAFARSIIRAHQGQFTDIVRTTRGWKIEAALPAHDTAGDSTIPVKGELSAIKPVLVGMDGSASSAGWLQVKSDSAAAPCKILLADDEESFRVYTSWVLRENGYEIVTAQDGQEAYELFKEAAPTFSLVILDSYMPRMGGLEAYLRMQALRPDLPVLFASGFARGASADALVSGCPGPAAVLLKPFGSEDLMLEVKKLLLRKT